MSTPKHTPTPVPWRCPKEMDGRHHQIPIMADAAPHHPIIGSAVFGLGHVPYETAKANAELICRAVNSHAALVEASKLALAIAESWIHDQLDGTTGLDSALQHLDPVRKALREAEGQL